MTERQDQSTNEQPDGIETRMALRPKDAAKALSIGERKLWELTNRSEIPHFRLGKAILYPVDALRDWMAAQTKGVKR